MTFLSNYLADTYQRAAAYLAARRPSPGFWLVIIAAGTVLIPCYTIAAIFGVRGIGRLEDGNRMDWHIINGGAFTSICYIIFWILLIRKRNKEHYVNWYYHRHVLPPRVSRTREEMERIILDAAERGEA